MSSKDQNQDHLSELSGPLYMDEEKEEEQAKKRDPDAVAVSGSDIQNQKSTDDDGLRMAPGIEDAVPSISISIDKKKKKSDNVELRMAPGVERGGGDK